MNDAEGSVYVSLCRDACLSNMRGLVPSGSLVEGKEKVQRKKKRRKKKKCRRERLKNTIQKGGPMVQGERVCVF